MRELMRYADHTGQVIALSPSADFGGNKAKFATFYKGLGFIDNKGKNKDFSISESMYRPAKENHQFALARPTPPQTRPWES